MTFIIVNKLSCERLLDFVEILSRSQNADRKYKFSIYTNQDVSCLYESKYKNNVQTVVTNIIDDQKDPFIVVSSGFGKLKIVRNVSDNLNWQKE